MAEEAAPPEVKKDVLRLRSRGKDLSTEEVKSMLTSRKFYATCWNYNGDFCNPDGEFENAFRDNGDGTVTDAATGLMWQKAGSDEAVTWIGAKEYADKSNREHLAGCADWRIPTAEEHGFSHGKLLEEFGSLHRSGLRPETEAMLVSGYPGPGVCLEGQLPHGSPHGLPHDLEEFRASGADPAIRKTCTVQGSGPRKYGAWPCMADESVFAGTFLLIV